MLLAKGPRKYSWSWMRSLSAEKLEDEREIIRKIFASAGNDGGLSDWAQALLERYDKASILAGVCYYLDKTCSFNQYVHRVKIDLLVIKGDL